MLSLYTSSANSTGKPLRHHTGNLCLLGVDVVRVVVPDMWLADMMPVDVDADTAPADPVPGVVLDVTPVLDGHDVGGSDCWTAAPCG
jgi:hypothetical protein